MRHSILYTSRAEIEMLKITQLSKLNENMLGQIQSGKKLDATMDSNLFWEFVINYQMKNTIKLRK